MTFTDLSFLLFVALLAGMCRIVPTRARASFLFAASMLYYFTRNARACLLLLALTVAVFFAGRFIAQARRRDSHKWLAPVVCGLLVAYLMAFKVALITPSRGIAGFVMPLGISFYSFRLISYVLDIHWGRLEPALFPDFAAFVTFFPQIVAGPIQRPGDFFQQAPYRPVRAGAAVARLALGLTKKLLIADNLAPAVDYVYSNMASFHGAPLWLAFYLYPFQLYADFSGLTDIAIGAGELLGVRGPENFNRPFTALSPGEYWRRWHMSLTSWLGDYLFTPLRMSLRKAGKVGLAASVTINMTAIGLWHGLTGTFLAFGLFHSVFLTADALSGRSRARFFKHHPQWDRAGAWLGWLVTFHVVCAGFALFRAPRRADAWWLLGHLFDGLMTSAGKLREVVEFAGPRYVAVGMAGYALLELAERYRPDLWLWRLDASNPRWARWWLRAAIAGLAVFGVALFIAHTGGQRSPFLYEIF
jgi:alginate O-acetyltransferase complex protein AlgI